MASPNTLALRWRVLRERPVEPRETRPRDRSLPGKKRIRARKEAQRGA